MQATETSLNPDGGPDKSGLKPALHQLTLLIGRFLRAVLNAAETPFPSSIVRDCLEKYLGTEIRPQYVRYPYLSIRNLPQEKIADSHITARTYQQVRIRHSPGKQKIRDIILGDI